jgi:hypothetical protein
VAKWAADGTCYRSAGGLPRFAPACPALQANDFPRLEALIAAWPADIRDHLAQLVNPATRGLPPLNRTDSK